MKVFARWGIVFLLIGMNFLLLNGEKESLSQGRGKTTPSESIRRDPFALPSGVRSRSQGEAPREVKPALIQSVPIENLPQETLPKETPLKLKAVLITDSLRLATIDQTIVQEGDIIKDEKVLEIRSDRVILTKGEKTRTLLLDQSPVKLIVEERLSTLSW